MNEYEILALRELEKIHRELQEQTRLLRAIERAVESEEPKYAKPEGISFVGRVSLPNSQSAM